MLQHNQMMTDVHPLRADLKVQAGQAGPAETIERAAATLDL